MYRYVFRRCLGALLVMWAVATLVFFMLRVVPGDPFAAMTFDAGDAQSIAALKDKLGYGQPVVVQYGKWLWHAVQGDLGNSIYGSRVPVNGMIAEAFPRTLSLATLSFLLALVIAIPAGLIAATRRNTPLDHGVTLVAFLGLSMPDFWLAILLIIFFAAGLQWLPAIGYAPLSDGFWPWLSHLIIPAVAAGTAFSAIIARMLRSALIEVLQTDYMRTARAKGLGARALLLGQALPNALIPVITVMGIAFALLMSSTVIVENVCAIKGLGRLLIQSILNRDYPAVQGAILVVSAIFVFSNLAVDLLYGLIDPRIRYVK